MGTLVMSVGAVLFTTSRRGTQVGGKKERGKIEFSVPRSLISWTNLYNAIFSLLKTHGGKWILNIKKNLSRKVIILLVVKKYSY